VIRHSPAEWAKWLAGMAIHRVMGRKSRQSGDRVSASRHKLSDQCEARQARTTMAQRPRVRQTRDARD